MLFFSRKLLTAGLAAYYGGIALLGYGLHELSPAHNHGASGTVVTHAHSHSHCVGHSHRHTHAPKTPAPGVPGISDSHECEICVFLDQLRGERPQLAVAIHWQHFTVEVVSSTPEDFSQAILGLHSPRGPPGLIA